MNSRYKLKLWDKLEDEIFVIDEIGFDECGDPWYLTAVGDDVPYFFENLGKEFEIVKRVSLKDTNCVDDYEVIDNIYENRSDHTC